MTAFLAETAAGHCAGSIDPGLPDAASVPAMAAFIWGLSTPGEQMGHGHTCLPWVLRPLMRQSLLTTCFSRFKLGPGRGQKPSMTTLTSGCLIRGREALVLPSLPALSFAAPDEATTDEGSHRWLLVSHGT